MSYLLKQNSAVLEPTQVEAIQAEAKTSQDLKTEKSCPQCRKTDFWRAKQSAGPASIGGQAEASEPPWLCWHCESPPIKSLVHQRSGPMAEALVVDRVKGFMADVVDGFEAMVEVPSPLAKPVIIAMEAPICPKCTGSFVRESATGDYSCWSCGAKIESERFLDCFSNPKKFCCSHRQKLACKISSSSVAS